MESKTYEDMSDFEIDVEITRMLTGLDPVDAEPHQRQRCYIARDYHNENYPPEVARQYVGVPNYCNNPSDAWSIIVENQISLTKSIESGIENWHADIIESIEETNSDESLFTCETSCNHYNKNPLRAAMICFLKMKDAEQ